MYLPTQEKIYREFFVKWMNDPSPAHAYMMKMRDLNMETSLSVFLGRYLSTAARKEINDGYWLITVALELVNFPFAWPGTKVWNAIQTRKMVMRYLEAASAKSKIRMADPLETPDCLLDEWTRAMIAAKKKAETGEVDETAKLLCREFSDHEISQVILSFLFASQDAMSSAIVYCFQLTADHPATLAKIREEQYRVRGNDIDRPLTLEMLDEMVYTRAAVKEVMRLMPSVIMVSAHHLPSAIPSCALTGRSPISPQKLSPSPPNTPYLRAAWSFPPSGTPFTTPHATRNPIRSSPSDGWRTTTVPSPLQRPSRRTLSSLVADRTR